MSEGGSVNCLFQAFVEYLVGMKLSAVTQTEGMSISALHQSSGKPSIWPFILWYPYSDSRSSLLSRCFGGRIILFHKDV